jgi:hypothetical protein
MQKWHKGPGPKTATTWQHTDKGPMRQTATTSWKQKDNQPDPLEDHRAGDREASCRDFQRAVKNQELDLVER